MCRILHIKILESEILIIFHWFTYLNSGTLRADLFLQVVTQNSV